MKTEGCAVPIFHHDPLIVRVLFGRISCVPVDLPVHEPQIYDNYLWPVIWLNSEFPE